MSAVAHESALRILRDMKKPREGVDRDTFARLMRWHRTQIRAKRGVA